MCFLSNKYGKCAVRQLKSMVTDFYDVSDVCGAKRQLIDDIKGMNLDVNVSERRESHNKAVLVVDSIFTLFPFLDENLKLTDNPDLMPSSRMYEGDLHILMKLIEKIGEEIKDLKIAMVDLARRAQSPTPKSSTPLRSLEPRSDMVFLAVSRRKTAVDSEPVQSRASTSTGDCETVVKSGFSQDQYVKKQAQTQAAGTSHSASVRDWSAAVVSTPELHNRYSELQNRDEDDDSDDPYVSYESRQLRKRRRRESKRPKQLQQSRADGANRSRDGNQQGQQQQRQQQQPHQQRQRARRVMVGSKLPSSDGRGIGAAKQLVKKAVFCVYNVKTSYGVDDDLITIEKSNNIRTDTIDHVYYGRGLHVLLIVCFAVLR